MTNNIQIPFFATPEKIFLLESEDSKINIVEEREEDTVQYQVYSNLTKKELLNIHSGNYTFYDYHVNPINISTIDDTHKISLDELISDSILRNID